MEFADHIWLPFLDQPQSDVVVFVIIIFWVNKIIVTEWKAENVPNYIIKFNEELENVSTANMERNNTDESTHEEAIIIFLNRKYLENKPIDILYIMIM